MLDWRDEAERLYPECKESLTPYSLITKRINSMGYSVDRYAVKNYIKRRCEKQDKPPSVNIATTLDIRPVGVFGDIHAPFNHPNYLHFVADTFEEYRVEENVCTGDLVDYHAISRHQKETCAKSPYDELDASILTVRDYTKAFPTVKMCKGNHDTIPIRQAATINMGDRFLKSYSELMELPDTWTIKNAFIINDVLYKHGLNCLGKDGAINTAILERMSTVIGHSHSHGGIKYSANHRNIIFGLNVGCGIDVDAYAFEYGRHAKYRPTLGCGVVFNSTYAIFVPMGAKYFRD